MAFQIIVDDRNEFCDICKTRSQIVDGRTMITIFQSIGRGRSGERNIIVAHLDEFERRLAKAKAKP